MFPFWDRMFGTLYEPEADHWPKVGLPGHPPPTSIIDYLLYPLRFAGTVNTAEIDQSAITSTDRLSA